MNLQNLFKRMRWNLLIAICSVMIAGMFAVGVVYAAATAGTIDGPPDTFPQSPLASNDFGDLPDNSEGGSFPISYDGLTLRNFGGAMHFHSSGLQLGSFVDLEDDGLPDGNALGDDNNNLDDEDGVTRDPQTLWTSSTTVNLDVVVNGCTGTCYLNGWIDWGLDGSFAGDQVFTNTHVFSVPNITNTLTIQVPADYTVMSPVYARFRLCSSDGAQPAGCNSLIGTVNNGEVEDYYWTFGPNAVELVSIEANTNYAVPFALLAGAVILLVSGGTILVFKRHRA